MASKTTDAAASSLPSSPLPPSSSVSESTTTAADPVTFRNLLLSELSEEMFTKLGLLINAQLNASAEDYQLLQKLNQLATEEHAQMADTAAELLTLAQSAQKKYKDLEPYLQQIDELEVNVSVLFSCALFFLVPLPVSCFSWVLLALYRVYVFVFLMIDHQIGEGD